MRGDIGRQPDRDSRGAVHQEVGKPAGERVRFHQRIVEIQGKVDGILVDIAQQLERQLFQARLRIAVCRGGISVHRAEIAVAVDQRHPHIEVLRHAHQRVVHRRVAVRVIFSQTVAHDLGTFFVRLVRRQPELVHRVQNAALNGLQTVLHPGQSAVQNDVLRIGHHGIMKDLVQRDFKNRLFILTHLFILIA